MGQGKKALDSTLRRRIPSSTGMLAYWPMEDEQGATAAYSPLPNVLPLTTTGLDFAAEDSLGGSSPLPKLTNPASLMTRVPGTTTVGWQVEFVYNLPTMPAAQTEIVRVAVTGAVLRTVVLYASTAGIRIEMLDKDDAILAFFLNTGEPSIAAFTGGWNRVAIYSGDAGGGQTRVQATWRDVSANIRYYASTFATTTQGRVTTVRGLWGHATEGMAIGHLAVSGTPGTGVSGSPPASSIFEGADDGFAGESVVNRMARLADEEAAQLDLSWRVGDPSTSSERMGPQRPSTLLDLLGEAAETDGGILHERLDRAVLVYRDRASLYNQRVALALDYLATGEVPPPLEPTEDDQNLRNDTTVTCSGGSSDRVVQAAGPLSVNPPPAGVGPYDESLTLSLYDDTQPERIVGWRVHLGTVDEARYPTISVWLHAAPHLIDTVLGMDIGDRLTIAHPPAWLPPDTIDQHALGYTEVLSQFEWTLTYNCTPASPWQVGVEGDPALARADTAGTVLNGAMTATTTVCNVNTTVGPRWVDSATYPSDFPFNIRVGGEVMRVNSCIGTTVSQSFSVTRSINGVAKAQASGTDVRLATPTIAALLEDHMPILSGMRLTSLRLNWARPEVYSATGTGDLAVTGTTTLIPGAEITVTTGANARIIADGAVNFLNGGTALTASSFCSTQLVVDGSTIPTFGRWGDTAAGSQGTPSQQWDITSLAAGTHTLRLSAARTSASTGTVTAVGAHSVLIFSVYEQIV
ncbi:hypothetical protein ABZ454_10845 [Streptomyces sp. NPDC005803]|uniref:hypothetical protein n=1 Tax=Streptomyces sp. NPDC005803 TaxID=3154297 RepID=UPI00340A8A05